MSKKQAGTGASWRHYQGSKIAKRLRSVKVFSSTASRNFFEKVSQGRKKTEREPFRIFQRPICRKPQKQLKGEIFSRNNLAMPKEI